MGGPNELSFPDDTLVRGLTAFNAVLVLTVRLRKAGHHFIDTRGTPNGAGRRERIEHGFRRPKARIALNPHEVTDLEQGLRYHAALAVG